MDKLSSRNDVDTATVTVEHNFPVYQREQRVVFALANTFARMPAVSDLSDQDVACDHGFTAKFFDATTLCV